VEQSRLQQARERQWGDRRAQGMRMEEWAGARLPSCTGVQTSTRTLQVRAQRPVVGLDHHSKQTLRDETR